LHLDVLKVQHHGSVRNASREFFQAVPADTYVISAAGRYGNPDLDTLQWIVESGRSPGDPITLVVTNETESCRMLQKKFDAAEYGYNIRFLPAGQHTLAITLAA